MQAKSTRICGIYAITNTTNGKVYIGSGQYIKRRWTDHRRDLRNHRHSNPHLQAAWDRDGEAAFVFAIVEEVADPLLLIEREQYWLDETRCYEPERGYNISPTAYSILGYRFTDEQKARVSAGVRGKTRTPEQRARIWANREVTDEHRAQMSRVGSARKGVAFSPAHSAAKAAAQIGEKNHQAKLTDAQRKEIQRRVAAGESQQSLATEFGVNEGTIIRVKYSDPDINQTLIDGSNRNAKKLTDAQVSAIRQRLHAGERGRALAAEFGVTESRISHIKHGKSRAREERE